MKEMNHNRSSLIEPYRLALRGIASASAVVARFFSLILQSATGDRTPCRFEPSCTVYLAESIEKRGIARGFWFGFRRVMRCRPGGVWGHDPVLEQNRIDNF